MKITTETSLKDFEFWSGAKETVEYLTEDEMSRIEEYLEENYPEGITETEVNDFFWFEDDKIAQILGYDDFEELMRSRKEEIECDEECED